MGVPRRVRSGWARASFASWRPARPSLSYPGATAPSRVARVVPPPPSPSNSEAGWKRFGCLPSASTIGRSLPTRPISGRFLSHEGQKRPLNGSNDQVPGAVAGSADGRQDRIGGPARRRGPDRGTRQQQPSPAPRLGRAASGGEQRGADPGRPGPLRDQHRHRRRPGRGEGPEHDYRHQGDDRPVGFEAPPGRWSPPRLAAVCHGPIRPSPPWPAVWPG